MMMMIMYHTAYAVQSAILISNRWACYSS